MQKLQSISTLCMIVAFGLGLTMGQLEDTAETMQAVKSSLPSFEHRVGFRALHKPKAEMDTRTELTVRGMRNQDGLIVTVRLYALPTVEKAQSLLSALLSHFSAQPVRNWPTKRRAAEEMWQSPNIRRPSGNWLILARDGLTVVTVGLELRPRRMIEGRPESRVFERSDLRMAEDLAIAALNKMTRLGYTSKRAQPSAAEPKSTP